MATFNVVQDGDVRYFKKDDKSTVDTYVIDPAAAPLGAQVNGVKNDVVAINGNLANFNVSSLNTDRIIIASKTNPDFVVTVKIAAGGELDVVFADGALGLFREADGTKVRFDSGEGLNKNPAKNVAKLNSNLNAETTYADVAEPAPAEGQSFTLTADIDELTGEAGDDVFNAGLTVAGTATLQAFDVLNGGEGADTLNATLTADVGAVTLNSIETLNLRATDTVNPITVDLENATGVERVVNNRSIGDLTVNNVQNLVEIAVNGVGTENDPLDFTVNYDAAALGAADTAQSIELNNAQLDTLTIGGAANLTSLNIAVTGENAVQTALNVTGADVDTLTVTGAGSLAVDGVIDAGTINAAGVAGDLELTLGTTGAADLATGVTTRTVVLGSGDDTLDVSAVDLSDAAEGSFAGGAGRDTIVVDGDTSGLAPGVNLVDLLAEKVSGFEVLNLDELDAAVSDSVLRALGYQALIVTDAANGASVTGLTAASSLTLVNTEATPDVIVLEVSGAATNDNAAFTLTVEGQEANSDSEFDITIADVENLTVNTVKNSAAADHTVTTLTLTDAALENLTVAGSEAVFVDVAGFANLERVDVSGVTAASDAAVDEFAAEIIVGDNVTVIGSAGDDSITFGEQSTITGGAGADTFVVGLVNTADASTFSTITDFSVAQEDSIAFGSMTLSAATGGTAVNLIEVADLALQPGVEATFQNFLTVASSANTGSATVVSAFVFQGNTYVVADETDDGAGGAGNVYTAAADYIVQLAGVVDLSGYVFS